MYGIFIHQISTFPLYTSSAGPINQISLNPFSDFSKSTSNVPPTAFTCIFPVAKFLLSAKLNAAAVICAHNHPSGDCQPSIADQAITRRIKDALKLVDIRMLDHLVVSGAKSESMEELGLI